MRETDPWDRFWGSGKIEDYLYYAGVADHEVGTYGMPGTSGTPELHAADMVAMNNAAELSGIGGVDTFGMNNLAALARQSELNGHSAIRDLIDPAE